MGCNGAAQKNHVPEIEWRQGRGHACKCDRFYDPVTFDEDFGTLQSPGVRADAQCFKLTWLEEIASERNTIQADFMIPGCLTRILGHFRAQGSALTRNVSRLHRSKNLLQRGILYRHEKIILRQGRLQSRIQENYI